MLQTKIISEDEEKSYQDHLNEAQIAFSRKDFEAAIEHYQKGISLYLASPTIDKKTFIPFYAALQQNLGVAFYETKKYKEAEKAFSKAIQFEPQNAVHYFNVGNLFFSKDQYENAIFLYTKAITLKPDFFEAHSNLGGIYLIQNDLKNAKKYFTQALKINPQDRYALEGMQYIMRDERQLKHFKAKVNAERRHQFLYSLAA